MDALAVFALLMILISPGMMGSIAAKVVKGYRKEMNDGQG